MHPDHKISTYYVLSKKWEYHKTGKVRNYDSIKNMKIGKIVINTLLHPEIKYYKITLLNNFKKLKICLFLDVFRRFYFSVI